MKRFDVHKWNIKRRVTERYATERRINEQFNTQVADKYEGILTFEKMFPMFSDYDDQEALDVLKKTFLPINRYIQTEFEKTKQFGSPKEAIQVERTGKSPELGGRPIISSADELTPQMVKGLMNQLSSKGMDLSNFEADNPIDAINIHFATMSGGWLSPARLQPLFKLKNGKVEEMQQHTESDSFPYPFVPSKSDQSPTEPVNSTEPDPEGEETPEVEYGRDVAMVLQYIKNIDRNDEWLQLFDAIVNHEVKNLTTSLKIRTLQAKMQELR